MIALVGFRLFVALVMAHALVDFPLQTDSMARGKNRHNPPTNIPPGQKPMTIWPYWLTSHALIHGAAVWILTGSFALGVAEFLVHWFTDFAKCENWTGIHTDQSIHVGCKMLWAVMA